MPVKVARNLNLGDVPKGVGPQQMRQALLFLQQAKALSDPTQVLDRVGLSRGAFEKQIDRLASQTGDRYDFESEKKDVKTHAAVKGLLGALVGGTAGYAANRQPDATMLFRPGSDAAQFAASEAKRHHASKILSGVLFGVGGALLGGGLGALQADQHNKDLTATARVLRDYGLSRPEYLRESLPLLKKSASPSCSLVAIGRNLMRSRKL